VIATCDSSSRDWRDSPAQASDVARLGKRGECDRNVVAVINRFLKPRLISITRRAKARSMRDDQVRLSKFHMLRNFLLKKCLMHM
jgi:hypothetical protein